MLGYSQKGCGGCLDGCKPILLFSLAQDEQIFSVIALDSCLGFIWEVHMTALKLFCCRTDNPIRFSIQFDLGSGT